MSVFQTIIAIILVWEQEKESSSWRKREKKMKKERNGEKVRKKRGELKKRDNLLISNSLPNFLDEKNRYD